MVRGSDGWRDVVVAAALAVAGCGGAEHVDDSQRVVKGLASGSVERRLGAARLVPKMGFVPADAVEPLLAMLGDADPAARRAAAEAVAYLGDSDEDRVQRVLAVFHAERDSAVRDSLRTALERMGVVFEIRR